jgi:hypothetical protein
LSMKLVGETDAASLLAEVEHVATGHRDPLDLLPQLWAAVAALAAKDVPGEHSLCGRTSGTAVGLPHAKARCSRLPTRPRKLVARAVVA